MKEQRRSRKYFDRKRLSNFGSKAFGTYRKFQEAKEKAFEESFVTVESRDRLPVFLLSVFLTILLWLAAIYVPLSIAELLQETDLFSVLLIGIIFYLMFYTGSTFIFRPTQDEISDDTSTFALFSACERKAMRSLLSAGCAVIHTFIYLVFVILTDPRRSDRLFHL